MAGTKLPTSALVLVHTPDLHVLLLERADFPGHWQSVTGSAEPGEALHDTAVRELAEETGIDARRYGGVIDWNASNQYEIYLKWRHRYPEGTTHNTEHLFSLQVPSPLPVVVAPREHLQYVWLPWQDAAQRCFSWTNRDAIRRLPDRLRGANAKEPLS